MSQLQKSQAIVLSSIRWKESSKIITIFSREWGVLKVIARGVYRKNNPVAGKIESLNFVEIVISTKQTRSLQILTEVDLIDSYTSIRIDLDKLSYALSILELIGQTIEEYHSDEQFFDFTVIMLETLKNALKPDYVLIYFILKLSSFLGFKPNFSECSSCAKAKQNKIFYFSIEKGTSYCEECAAGINIFYKLSGEEISFLSNIQKFPHRKINEFTYNLTSGFNFIHFLIEYLDFHLGQSIKLRSLNLIQK